MSDEEADDKQALRQRAEEKLTSGVVAAPEGLVLDGTNRLLHELQVHQIELAMQNEELRRAQTELEASRARYLDLYELAPVGYLTVSEQGLIVTANLTAATLLGVARGALLKQPFSRFIWPEDCDLYYLHGKRLLGAATPQAWEMRMRHADGSFFWAQMQASLTQDGDGAAVRCRIVLADITARKQLQEEGKRNELRLKRMVDILQHPSATIKDFLEYALAQALQLTGSKIGYIYQYHADRKEFVLNTWSRDVMAECAVDKPATCYELDKTGLWGEAVRQRRPIVVNDFQAGNPLKKGYPAGHVHLLKFMTVPIFKDESIVGVIGLANKATDYDETDILQVSLLLEASWKVIERMKAEEENATLQAHLHQAQKMEAIGVLAGGIAHDFNNILAVILGYTEMAREDAPPCTGFSRDLDKVLSAAHRAKELVKQILAFSRQSAAKRIPLNLQPLVKESLKMLRASLPSTITIHENVYPRCGVVLADPTQVYQIIMNLCTNAFQAMESAGGVLTVELKMAFFDSPTLVDGQLVPPGAYVVLVVSDSGTGIGPEIISKIFDPFFTTKEIGKGTGMGLAIAHGIVKSYGGAITVASALGQGTVFHVYFPVIQEEVAAAAENQEAPKGKGRILLVDDEELLAELGKDMLERLGYSVTAHTRSSEALAAFVSEPDQFDLVITDQTMPGLTGIELAKRMLQVRPDVPIILCTGFSQLVDEDSARRIGIREFALKPLSKASIAILLQRVMGD